MKSTRFSRGEFILIAAITLAFAALSALGLRAYLERDNRWVRIVSPTDAKAVETVAVSRLLQPYVRTDQGTYYFCSGTTWRDTCAPVDETRLPATAVPPRWQTCAPDLPQLPEPPGEIVHSLDFARCQEARIYARIIILTDGSIWRWQRSFSWVNGFAFASGVFWSLVIGGLIGVGVVLLRRYLKTPVPGAKKA